MNLEQSNRLKGLAILQVVVIHSMAVFTPQQWGTPGLFSVLLISIDQLSRICVPIFIFLSWYGLEKKFQGKKIHYFPFLISRTKKLIPLYLLWSIGSLLLMKVSPMWQFSPQLPFLIKVLLGQSDYQHYFVPIILFFYAIFPFASGMTKQIKILATPVVLGVTIAWYLWLPKLQLSLTQGLLQPDQELYLWPFTWGWYAWLGLLAADVQLIEQWTTRKMKLIFLLLTIFSAIFMVNNAYNLIQSGIDVLLALRFTNLPVLIYASFAILLLSMIVQTKHSSTWLAPLGSFSFLIYLAHTFFIRLTVAQLRVPDTLPILLIGFISFGLLSYFSWRLMKKTAH